jgi:hypothetical protein
LLPASNGGRKARFCMTFQQIDGQDIADGCSMRDPIEGESRVEKSGGGRTRMAERVGFEPTVREARTPDFESGAFDHSATFPSGRIIADRSVTGGARNSPYHSVCSAPVAQWIELPPPKG